MTRPASSGRNNSGPSVFVICQQFVAGTVTPATAKDALDAKKG